jgi:MFS-type transporter involved in bile tolerance (Atg22 family)
MKADKNNNYKPLMAIQMIATIVLGASLFFVSGELYKVLATLLVAFTIGLLIPTLLFYVKPGLFGDKVKSHPHEDRFI